MMPRLRLLNTTAAATRTDPVALSRELLAEARALTGPEQCSHLDSLAGQFHGVAPSEIAGDASRIAFWANVYNALDLATRTYLEGETVLEPERRRVHLPRLMRLYATDFGDRQSQLEFASRYLPRLADLLRETEPGVRLRYRRFDWTVAAGPS